MYSNELRKKLSKKLSAKIYYDSPLNDLNSFNFNTRRSYSTAHGALCTNKHKIDELQIDPWFITGFTEAEGCFTCSILKSPQYKFGWEVQLTFQIKLHVKDLPVLLVIQQSLNGIGSITTSKSASAFRVRKFNEIVEVVKFFDKYPLISKKKEIIYYLKKLYLLCHWKNIWLRTQGGFTKDY